jgi:MATE family multidrug resistance protein
VNDD